MEAFPGRLIGLGTVYLVGYLVGFLHGAERAPDVPGWAPESWRRQSCDES
jgi:hypothetical protein